jgi:hypothetical protein
MKRTPNQNEYIFQINLSENKPNLILVRTKGPEPRLVSFSNKLGPLLNLKPITTTYNIQPFELEITHLFRDHLISFRRTLSLTIRMALVHFQIKTAILDEWKKIYSDHPHEQWHTRHINSVNY